jgi:isoaspartyl peptidase/L-asparaginase-like protein (Ntn-hydrolase superfamily)
MPRVAAEGAVRGSTAEVPDPLSRRAAALAAGAVKPASQQVRRGNHDTIGMCVLDAAGNLVVGGSTNGASHKIAGRVSGQWWGWGGGGRAGDAAASCSQMHAGRAVGRSLGWQS